MSQRNKNTGRNGGKKNLSQSEMYEKLNEVFELLLESLIPRLDELSDTDRIAFMGALLPYVLPPLNPVNLEEEDDDLADLLNFN